MPRLTLSRIALASMTVASLCACKPAPRTHVDAPSGQWISLFNGHDLTGWTVKIAHSPSGDNYRNTFRVENGLLAVSYQQYERFDDRFGSIYYDKPLSHYWLRVEYRFTGDLAPGAPRWAFRNSGIQIHSQAPATLRNDQTFPVSVEFDLVGGRSFGSYPTGNVCHYGTSIDIDGKPLQKQCSTSSDVTIRDDEWVTALAEVNGSQSVRQIVNGDLLVSYSNLRLDESNADAKALLAAGAGKELAAGYLSLQSNGAPVQFRKIEILPIGPEATAAAPAAPAAAQ